MPQVFNRASDMIDKMRADLVNRTFPGLLTGLATAARAQLQSDIAAAAAKVGGRAPAIKIQVVPVPSPGTAGVTTSYVGGPAGDRDDAPADVRSSAESAAYKEVFRRFNDSRLSSKALVLKLLASVGVA